ncbi:MAG TPA: DinB family protein [Ktedonobacterales bacterium]|nr:DinB family protein [Ktedonobacterales bacterium]
MPRRPCRALKVNDLASSLAFYVEGLGFHLVESQPDADRAPRFDPYGEPILLAGPAVAEVSAALEEPRIVYQSGATLDFIGEDLDVRLAALSERGQTATEQQTGEGDRQLILTDLSNYTILIVQQRAPEKTRALYFRGADDIAAALAGLAEADLDLTRGPDEWSIRQIVHHLAETDSMFLMALKTALAQSGTTFVRNPYEQDHWVAALAYQARAIEPSLALLTAMRAHLAQLFQQIPDHWDRYVLMKFESWESEGDKVTIGALLDSLNWHLAEHCAEIQETRRLHQR